jgi:glycerol 2-dehydrogenase (NADP+)
LLIPIRTECDPFPTDAEGQFILDESVTFNDSYAELEKLLAAGKTRAIGVSNFSIEKLVAMPCLFALADVDSLFSLEKLATTAKITPAVNQIE